MNRFLIFLPLVLFFSAAPARAGFLDDLTHALFSTDGQQSALDSGTIAKGLKEALATGTERAVAAVARTDGYYGNSLIKILLPEKVQQAAELLGTLGYRQQVDAFVLSMNRAAEKAAPQAAAVFGDAIRQMTLEDARGILGGGETAATRFFEAKTRPRLVAAFKPTITAAMDQVGVARAYKEMLGATKLSPVASLAGIPSLDLDSYVTDKALDGLFTVLAQEEQKIRTDPAARTTDLLRQVFSSGH